MTGGYSEVARHLTRVFGVPFSRNRVYDWHQRGTLNAAGNPFPRPVTENTQALRTQPRWQFDLGDVERWARAGIPRPHWDGFETPEQMRERLSTL